MLKIDKIEKLMQITLTRGTLLSIFLVVIGAVLYLIQFGQDSIQPDLFQSSLYHTNIFNIWEILLTTPSTGIIQLGLLVLVATQIIRVAMLVIFYSISKDYNFIIISLFILLLLCYSFIWPHN